MYFGLANHRMRKKPTHLLIVYIVNVCVKNDQMMILFTF
jgi:hypothetical protein